MNYIFKISFFLFLFVSQLSISQKSDKYQDGIYKSISTSFDNKFIQFENLLFTAKKYIISDDITTKDFELVTIYFNISNDSNKEILIDLDNLNLIDSNNIMSRVELVQGLSYNENDKFILKVKANKSINRKIHFIIRKGSSISKLSYMNKTILLI
jgi:hypothetical protein